MATIWWEVLRCWVYLTAISSIVEFWKCYQVVAGQAQIKSTYPRAQWQETSQLAARQLGLNHALLALIRIYGGLFLDDEAAFKVCHWSFVLLFFHFVWERFGTGTVGGRNLSITEAIAFISIWAMFLATFPAQSAPLNHPGMLGYGGFAGGQPGL